MKIRFRNSWRLFAIFTVIGSALIGMGHVHVGWVLIVIAVVVLVYTGFKGKD